MTFDEIIAELKNKIYRPIYFLTGDENYYIDKLSDYIQQNVLNICSVYPGKSVQNLTAC